MRVWKHKRSKVLKVQISPATVMKVGPSSVLSSSFLFFILLKPEEFQFSKVQNFHSADIKADAGHVTKRTGQNQPEPTNSASEMGLYQQGALEATAA